MRLAAARAATGTPARGPWPTLSEPLPEFDRAEAALANGDLAAAAFFYDLALARLHAAATRVEAANDLPGGGMDRMLAIARDLGPCTPDPHPALVEYRVDARTGRLGLWLVLGAEAGLWP